MEKLRIGLIGVGFIGSLHARIISENPNAELVAIADLNKAVADKLAEKYNCTAYGDYNEMLRRSDIDAVDICVPEDFHVAPAVAAAKAKKNILIEKPIAKTVAEAMEIKKAADENGVRLMVAHVLKFDPRYVQLNDAIKAGKLGDITSLALKRTNSTGTPQRLKGKVSFFYYMGVHDIEWMLDYNSPAKPVKVYAQASDIVLKGLDLDAAFVTVTFDNGSIGSLELNWAFPQNGVCGFMTTVEAVGSKGAAMLNVDNQGLMVATSSDVELPDALHWPEYNGKIQGDLKEEIDHFVQATLKKQPYLVSTERAIASIAVIEASLKSIKTGMPVTL
jgi:UDP-N-acetylglucosamine 3-dehydrogenase